MLLAERLLDCEDTLVEIDRCDVDVLRCGRLISNGDISRPDIGRIVAGREPPLIDLELFTQVIRPSSNDP